METITHVPVAEADQPLNIETIRPDNYDSVGFDINAPIIDGLLVVNKSDIEARVDVVAQVDDPVTGNVGVVYRHEDGFGVGLLRAPKDGKPPLLEGTKLVKDEYRHDGKKIIAEGTIELERNKRWVGVKIVPEDGSGKVTIYDLHEDGEKQLEVSVASETSNRKRRRAEKKVQKTNRESYRAPSRRAKIAARIGFAAMAISSPNSVLDKAHDVLDDQAAIVEEVGEEIEDAYSGDLESHRQATERVESVVFAIDKKDAEFIGKQEAQFERKYGQTDKQLKAKAIEAINNANTLDEAMEAANIFLSQYGINAGVELSSDDDIPLEEKDLLGFKFNLESTIKTIGLFSPESLRKVTNLERIHYAKIALDGKAAGYTYGTGSHDITVALPLPSSIGELMAVLGLPLDDGNTLPHELGHTYMGSSSNEGVGIADMQRPVLANNEANTRAIAGYFASRFIRRPSDPSFYGATEIGASGEGLDERHADVFSLLMRHGVPDPNKGFEFASRLSKQEIATLIDLENTLPGFSAHLAYEFGQAESIDDPIRSVREQSIERQAMLALFGVLLFGTRKQRAHQLRSKTVYVDGKIK